MDKPSWVITDHTDSARCAWIRAAVLEAANSSASGGASTRRSVLRETSGRPWEIEGCIVAEPFFTEGAGHAEQDFLTPQTTPLPYAARPSAETPTPLNAATFAQISPQCKQIRRNCDISARDSHIRYEEAPRQGSPQL